MRNVVSEVLKYQTFVWNDWHAFLTCTTVAESTIKMKKRQSAITPYTSCVAISRPLGAPNMLSADHLLNSTERMDLRLMMSFLCGLQCLFD